MGDKRLEDAMLPELRAWLDYNLAAGCSPQQLEETLVENGFLRADVTAFVGAETARRQDEAQAYDVPPAAPDEVAQRFWRQAGVIDSFNRMALGDRIVRVLAKSPPQGVFLVEGFLSEAECDGLVAEAQGAMAASMILDEDRGTSVVDHTRSSRGGVIPRGASPLVRAVESRIARLTDLPVGHGESLQILHYGLGGEYRPHFDYFDPESPGGARLLTRNSQRAATVILYLNEVEGGGATLFPELGLAFTPLKGAALLFPSMGADGALLPTSLHAGCPVTSGEKWIATKWIRLTPQPGP